jgi:hypothetical protein
MKDLAKDTIASMKYANIIQCLSEMNNISLEDATEIFYNSETFTLIDDGVADLHCRSDKYLANEIWAEYQESKCK